MSKHKSPRRILLVDDDVSVTDVLSAYLRRDGFSVDVLHDGAEARDSVVADPGAYDLFLIDLGLPGLSGERLCLIVSSLTKAPIIVVSGKAGTGAAVTALELGADDYLAKPFSPRELVARVRAKFRREERYAGRCEERRCGPLRILPAARKVFVDGKETPALARAEFEILMALSSEPSAAVSRDALCRSVGVGGDALCRSMAKLRADLGSAGGCVKTVRGFGYRLDVTGEAA